MVAKALPLVRFLLGSWLLLCTASQLTAQESQPELESVVWVEATRTLEGASKPQRHAGTGFLWLTDRQVVTSLHVVAGCEAILVSSRSREKERAVKAKLVRVLLEADLALLELEEPMGRRALQQQAEPGAVGQDLLVRGFPLEIKKPGPTSVKLRDKKPRKLSDIITPESIPSLQKLGFPSLELKVLDIEGALVPGHSGAPLQNAEGALVGIGSGGIQKGAVDRAWAIPAFWLKKLPESKDKPPQGLSLWQQVESLFAISQEKHSPFVIDKGEPFERRPGAYNILILPFSPLENCTFKETEIEETVKRRLLEKSEEEGLGLQIKLYRETSCPERFEEARAIGKAFNADLVLWGDLYEHCDEKSQACLKYAVVNKTSVRGRAHQKSEISQVDMAEMMQGKLQRDVDYVIYWTLGVRFYKKREYKQALQYFNREEMKGEDNADVLSYQGVCLAKLGKYREAKLAFEQEVAERRAKHGDENVDTLTSMSNLALTLSAQGDLPAARKLQEQVLELRTRILGTEHPDTLTSMSNLAVTLSAQGDLPAARKLQEQVLERRTRILGTEHPDTLSSMSNLALTLSAQGDRPAARKLQEQVLELMTRILGTEHPGTLSSMSNLALTLSAQGDRPAARKLQEQVLELVTRILGTEHPDTLTSMSNLANTLSDQGDLPAARKLQEQVLERRTRILGTEHPDALSSMSNLANTLSDQGDLPAARKLQEQVLELRTRISGTEHPDTLSSMSNLALTLSAQGDLPAARKLQEQVLELMTRILGSEHPDTLSSMSNLALTLSAQGDLPAARKLQEQVLELMARILGSEHPVTLSSMSNLASTLSNQGDRPAARKLQEQVLELMTRILGTEHPHTLSSMSNLASTLSDQGDLPAARKLQERVLELRTRILGTEHPGTLTSMYNLACTLNVQKEYMNALHYFELAHEGFTKKMGARHDVSVSCLFNTFLTHENTNNHDAALKILEQLKWLLDEPDERLSARQKSIKNSVSKVLHALEK